MKLFFSWILVTITFLYAGEPESFADAKPVATTGTSIKRTCRIVFPERPNDAPKAAYLYDGSVNHRVDFPSMNFSKVIELPTGECTITLSPTKVTDPKNISNHAPTLSINESVRDFYILVRPDPSNPELPVQMRLVNISNNKLKPGQTLWINQTDHKVSAKLGEQEISVRPEGETVSKNPISSSGYYRAEFNYHPDDKGESYKIAEQQWWHDANSRHLGFIVDSGGRLPKIYFFRDFR